MSKWIRNFMSLFALSSSIIEYGFCILKKIYENKLIELDRRLSSSLVRSSSSCVWPVISFADSSILKWNKS